MGKDIPDRVVRTSKVYELRQSDGT